MRINKRNANNKARTVWIIIGVILVSLVAYLSYAYITKSIWPFHDSVVDNTTSQNTSNDVNYSPPTEDEIANSQSGKTNSREAEQEKDPETQLNKVSVAISYADKEGENFEVRAFTTSVIEGTGKCTATLTATGDKTVKKTSEAFIDATSSQCRPIYIPLQDLTGAKTWTMVIDYLSPTSKGATSPEVITL